MQGSPFKMKIFQDRGKNELIRLLNVYNAQTIYIQKYTMMSKQACLRKNLCKNNNNKDWSYKPALTS